MFPENIREAAESQGFDLMFCCLFGKTEINGKSYG